MLPDGLCDEVTRRIENARRSMEDQNVEALLIYGNNKVNGSLRYMSGYFPDRGGWIAMGPNRDRIHIFDGATLVLPLEGDPLLAFDPGQLFDRESCIHMTTISGFGEAAAQAPSLAQAIVDALIGSGVKESVGIETWDKFPAPLYLALTDLLPGCNFRQSTIVEELVMFKSPWEVDILRKCGEIGDLGHQAFADALAGGIGKSEVELIRVAETAMREANPVYEECSPISPSLICSGESGPLILLHVPLEEKKIRPGDAVNWDICGRYLGYPIDTSRTRVVGAPSYEQIRAYEAALAMSDEIFRSAMPGVNVQDLVTVAEDVAKSHGLELWDRFIGHGLGLDAHGRPDMGFESSVLAENMVITVEPRISLNDEYLFGNEDMVLITNSGPESLTMFPKEPLGL